MKIENMLVIDPGASGAAVLRDIETEAVLDVTPFKSQEDVIDAIRAVSDLANTVVVIEIVNSSPKMGHSQAFAFGGSFHGPVMVAKAFGLPVIGVYPQEWMRGPGFSSLPPSREYDKRKRALRDMAQDRYPELSPTLDTCDALLLSDYCIDKVVVTGSPGGKPL